MRELGGPQYEILQTLKQQQAGFSINQYFARSTQNAYYCDGRWDFVEHFGHNQCQNSGLLW
jgi:hypothetical protein